MYTGADLQNVCREAALVALRTRILGPSSSLLDSSKSTVEDVSPKQEPVVSSNFERACADVPIPFCLSITNSASLFFFLLDNV